jgi:hypothetical protein
LKIRNPFRRKKKSKSSSGSGQQQPSGTSNSEAQEQLAQQKGGPKQEASVLQLAMAAAPKKKPAHKKKSSKRRKKNDGVKANKLLRGRDVKFMKSLGGGSANDVYKARYKKEIADSGTKEGFWKASEGNESAKAMASSRLDQALGTNMLSRDVEAKHKGQLGITSAKVEGEAMSENKYTDLTDQYIEGFGSYEESVKQIKEMGMEGMHTFDDEGQTISKLTGSELLDVDLKNPEVQRGMANLEVLDYLTGQEDRHEGNIFVDPQTGKVSGIDNDMSFGGDMTAEKFQELGDNNINLKVQGLPSQIDADLGMRILVMEESEFLQILEGNKKDRAHLTEEEKESAVDRFRHLKVHVDNLYMNDGFIWQWNDDTYDEAVESGKGYLARAVRDREGDDVNLKPRSGPVA